MSAVGIICEYNPFHKGHKYQIEKARELSGANTVVAVMNGNFVQRGEPAVVDKYTRTAMALAEGADFVFELPLRYGISSAEDFARGGILALKSLPFVESFCFGSECADEKRLLAAGHFFAGEPQEYRLELERLLRAGHSYPMAREQAYISCTNESEAMDLFGPNSTLGIEYIKAAEQLQTGLKPIVIERQGMGYHETVSDESSMQDTFLSATAIRENLRNNRFDGMPSDARDIFMKCGTYVDAEDFWTMCSYAIREHWEDLEQIKDMSEELASIFRKNWYTATSFTDFIGRCKTKNQTMARIKRCVFQILFGIKKSARQEGSLPYLRLLGMRRQAADVLGQVEDTVLLGRLAKDREKLDGIAAELLEKDILAADIYSSVVAAKSGQSQLSEFQRPILVVE